MSIALNALDLEGVLQGLALLVRLRSASKIAGLQFNVTLALGFAQAIERCEIIRDLSRL